MALIVCETCHKEISDEAKKCPLCGASTQHGKKAKRFLLRGVIIAVLLILAMSVFVFVWLSGKAGAEMLTTGTLVAETTVDAALENIAWEGNRVTGFIPIDKDWRDGSVSPVMSFVNPDDTVLIEWRSLTGSTMAEAVDSAKFAAAYSPDSYGFLAQEVTTSYYGKEGFAATILERDPTSQIGIYGSDIIVDTGYGFTSIKITSTRGSAVDEYDAWCAKYFSLTNVR